MPSAASSSSDGLRLVVGAVDAVVRDLPVAGDRVQRRLRHGVDHTGRDQVGDVPGVVVGGVLDAGGRPQRALRPGARRLERLPPAGGDRFLVALVGEPGVGDRGLAAQCGRLPGAELVQPPVDLGVDPGHEERGDRGDAGQVPLGGASAFHAGQEGLDHSP